MLAGLGILLLWVAFGASHLGLSSASLRPRLVERLGEARFQLLYSAISLLCFVPLVWLYFSHTRAGPVLYQLPLPAAARVPLYLLMAAAFVLIASGLVQPGPTLLGRGRSEVRGVHRITRHPLFMGLGLVGLLHLVATGSFTDVVFFGGFPVFAVLGCRHLDRRRRASADEALRHYCQQTPSLPFTGRETWQGIRELPRLGVGLGIAATLLLGVFHEQLFG